MKSKLQEMRKKAGFKTAREYAEAKNISLNTYNNYEQGKSQITLKRAIQFAQDFNCSIDDIADYKRNPTNEEEALFYYYRSSSEEGKAAIIATAKAQSELERKNIKKTFESNIKAV